MVLGISLRRPLPSAVEQLALRFWWVIVGINLLGTAFGFWYYRVQFGFEPLVMLPLVPDSPVATLFFAVSFTLWAYNRDNEYLNGLAFLGCWKLGLWTPYVLIVFAQDALAFTPFPLYLFLVVSHVGMAVQAFLIPAYGTLSLRSLAAALIWYGLNDTADYFIPIVGTPHHTLLPQQTVMNGVIQHVPMVHAVAAAGALALTAVGCALLYVFIANPTEEPL